MLTKKNKEIILFNPSIEDGGVEKNLFLISNYLSKKFDNLTIITSDKNKNFSKKINIFTHFFSLSNNAGRKSKYFFCLILLIIKIILCKKKCLVFAFQANVYAIIVCYLLNVKIITRSNSSSTGWSKNILKNYFLKFFLKKADMVIVNSFDFKKELDKKFNIKTKVILNPFDFNEIKKKSLIRFKDNFFKKNTLNIITIGRFTEQKDHETFIKGIFLASKKKNIRAIIMGKGYLKNKLKNLIVENKLSKNILIRDYNSNPYKYIKNSDIFILTSIFEGHPNVLIEAQYLKKYIISTNCPTGPREILNNGKFGDLFKIKDYKTLSKLIIKYKKNKKNLLKVKYAFKNHKIYDHKKNCEEYFKIIMKII